MPPGASAGPEVALQFRAMLHAAFPDLRITIEDIVAEGDRVAVRARWTGAHRGPLPIVPVPVGNRPFSFTGMVFWRVPRPQDCGALGEHRPSGTDTTAYRRLVSRNRPAA